MAAAIIEFDALADAVGSAAQDDDFLFVGGIGFVHRQPAACRFIAGIHIGRQRREFGGAGIDPLETGPHIQRVTRRAHIHFLHAGQPGQAGVGKAHRFEAAESLGILRQAAPANIGFDLYDRPHFAQEPGIIAGDLGDLFQRKAVPHRLGRVQQPVRRGASQRGPDRGLVVRQRGFVEAG